MKVCFSVCKRDEGINTRRCHRVLKHLSLLMRVAKQRDSYGSHEGRRGLLRAKSHRKVALKASPHGFIQDEKDSELKEELMNKYGNM